MVGTAIDTIVWSMNVIATAKIIAARTRFLLCPLPDGMDLLVGSWLRPRYRRTVCSTARGSRGKMAPILDRAEPPVETGSPPSAQGRAGERWVWHPSRVQRVALDDIRDLPDGPRTITGGVA